MKKLFILLFCLICLSACIIEEKVEILPVEDIVYSDNTKDKDDLENIEDNEETLETKEETNGGE